MLQCRENSQKPTHEVIPQVVQKVELPRGLVD